MARSRGGAGRALVVAAALVSLIAAARARFPARVAACDGGRAKLDSVENCGACGVRCASVHGAASCVAGSCRIACDKGFADCDGHPGNGCEADLGADRVHCGSCSKSCSGAMCEGGVCAARHLATGVGVRALRADDRAVYTIGAGVLKYPLDGSEVVALTKEDLPGGDDKAPPDKPSPSPSSADGEDAYWVEAGAALSVVKRAPKRGGEGVVVASHPYPIIAIAVNPTHVFWLDERQRIFMAPKKPR